MSWMYFKIVVKMHPKKYQEAKGAESQKANGTAVYTALNRLVAVVVSLCVVCVDDGVFDGSILKPTARRLSNFV